MRKSYTVVSLCLLLIGCSSHLNRREAARLIASEQRILTLTEGPMIHLQIDPVSGCSATGLLGEIEGGHAALQMLGLIAIKGYSEHKASCVVSVTKKGTQLFTEVGAAMSGSSYEVPLGRWTGEVEVSGITQEGTSALVQYSLPWRPNTIGRQVLENCEKLSTIQRAHLPCRTPADVGQVQRDARFRLYDDGWRLLLE